MSASSTRTVDRALDLLISVTDHPEGQSLTELSRDTDLSLSTASRLLGTLAQHGFVRRDDLGTYRPGYRLIQVAAAGLQDDPLYELAGPHLEALAEATGETANLGVRIEGDRALYLRQVAGPHLVQIRSWTGRTISIEGTAMGAALSGELGEHGYAATRMTLEPDVTAVAVPVKGKLGDTIASLSISAPTFRTSDEDIHTMGIALVEHAAALSRQLGGLVGTASAS